MGDRIQIDGVGLAPQPQGFERNGPTACEGIEDFWRIAIGIWV
jgi:hypothetical protein